MKNSLVMELQRERMRRIINEGYTPDHDDKYIHGSLSRAAAAYALHGGPCNGMMILSVWPWETDAFKPSDRRRNLVKAGALILAEIERLDRIGEEEKEEL